VTRDAFATLSFLLAAAPPPSGKPALLLPNYARAVDVALTVLMGARAGQGAPSAAGVADIGLGSDGYTFVIDVLARIAVDTLQGGARFRRRPRVCMLCCPLACSRMPSATASLFSCVHMLRVWKCCEIGPGCVEVHALYCGPCRDLGPAFATLVRCVLSQMLTWTPKPCVDG
jgi:hypothetical protein